MKQLPIEFISISESVSVEESNKMGVDLAEVMVRSNLANTKSEARRHIKQGAVRLNDQVVKDPFARLAMKDNQIVVFERVQPTDFFQ